MEFQELIQEAQRRSGRRNFPSCSPEEMAKRNAEAFNRSHGNLNDGYDCPICLNRGMIENPPGTMRYCACKPIRDSLNRLRKIGLEQAAKRLTFDAYKATEPWQKTLLERAKAFSEAEKPGWFFVGGQSGCGKSHLCTAAVVALAYRGFELRYMRWANDSAALKTMGMDTGRGSVLDQFVKAPLLYIDDLFKTEPTMADKHIAFELLNARYNAEDSITVISSERTLTEIMSIDEALGGRIHERCGRDNILNVGRNPARNYRMRGIEEI